MANLAVIEHQGQHVVDSRLIAAELDIAHKSFIRTIKKYSTELQAFGQLGFEIATVTNSVGAVNQVTFCYLNEDQATFVMTLSRNTDKVVQCKMNLVQAFKEARQKVVPEIPAIAPRDTVEYIEAAAKLECFQESTLKQLLQDCLVDELELRRNQKALPGGVEKKRYTIVKVRAKQLGYTTKDIGGGSALGRFVHARIKPAYQEMVGRYPVYHYEINSELDTAIHTFFGASQTDLLLEG